ncbi:MAG TPA: hypothetical protein VFY12_12330 [Arenimonas sp.]|nr:hypothetical protein [Arenimonas sp.]
MRRLLPIAGLLLAVSAVSAQPCADRLREVRPASAQAGGEIELLGEFADARGRRRPVVNLGGVNDLEVIHWSRARIVARLPGKLAAGTYKVGIYCDGRRGPQRFLYATDFRDLVVHAAAAPTSSRRPQASAPAQPSALQFELWLSQLGGIADELVWEGIDGPVLYRHWPERQRQALYRAFRRSLDGASSDLGVPDNIADNRGLAEGLIHQQLRESDAEALYLDSVGHSLALEYAARLPWSLRDYPLAQLEVLLDAREFFAREDAGYAVDFGMSGMALQSPASEQWAFLRRRVGEDRRQTIVAVLDWLRDTTMHFEGRVSVATMQSQWQYPGYPPVARVLAGTPHLDRPTWPVRPRTAGCFGTAGFLRALLRSANIPVTMVSTCAHYQAHFPSEGLYLSHGDDPYSGEFTATGCSAERLLLDANTFQAWFRRGPEAQRCANIGRAAREAGGCR